MGFKIVGNLLTTLITASTASGVQNFIGADLTDRHRRHRPDCSTDRMSRGWRLDFTLHFDAGVVKSSD